MRADAFTNTLKTTVLLGALGGLFVLLGSLLGGRTGAMIGLAIGLVTVGISFFMSDKLALRSANAKLVDEQQAPELYAMVKDLAQRANLPMPRSPSALRCSPTPSPPGEARATRWWPSPTGCSAPFPVTRSKACWLTS